MLISCNDIRIVYLISLRLHAFTHTNYRHKKREITDRQRREANLLHTIEKKTTPIRSNQSKSVLNRVSGQSQIYSGLARLVSRSRESRDMFTAGIHCGRRKLRYGRYIAPSSTTMFDKWSPSLTSRWKVAVEPSEACPLFAVAQMSFGTNLVCVGLRCLLGNFEANFGVFVFGNWSRKLNIYIIIFTHLGTYNC